MPIITRLLKQRVGTGIARPAPNSVFFLSTYNVHTTGSLCNAVVFWTYGANRCFFSVANFPKMKRSFVQPVLCLDKWFMTWLHFFLQLIEVVFKGKRGAVV